MAQPVVEVKGLREFRRDLRALGDDYRKGLDRELKEAAKPIVEDARERYRIRHPRRGRSKGSQRGIRPGVSARGARVLLGSTRYPYLLGQEFGGHRFPQFPPRAPKPPGGYFFYAAISEGTQDLMEAIGNLVDKANRRHFEGR